MIVSNWCIHYYAFLFYNISVQIFDLTILEVGSLTPRKFFSRPLRQIQIMQTGPTDDPTVQVIQAPSEA